MKKITKAQSAKMKEHGKRHTLAHMKTMRKEMSAGKSFSAAHTIAKKK
tara:strand:+ start:15782 stop:15925 length:144 start_codon:yes stop_codon:yes gene_type:complete